MYGGRIAFIQACWHKDIVDQARDSFIAEIENHDLSPDRVDFFEVPGGLEIPLVAKRLAATGRYGIMAAAGLIVDGGIYRYDFVGAAIIDGMMRVQLDSGVPVISAVLTTQLFHDHEDHRKFFSIISETRAPRLPLPVLKIWKTWWRFRPSIRPRESGAVIC